MKKRFLILICALSLCLAGVFLAGCDRKKEDPPLPPAPQSNQGIVDGTHGNYEEETYSYSFESNGGSAVEGGTLYKNEYVVKPADPVRTGYRFTGWYFDEACTRLAEFFNYKMPERDLVFYAGWEKLSSVSFNTKGGEPMDTVYGVEGDAIGEISDPVRANYVFEGWYSDEDCTEAYRFGNFPKGDTTVYAKWREKRTDVQIAFVDENEETTNQTYAEGDVITLREKTPPQDEQYLEYVGWAVSSENNRVVKGSYTVTNVDTTLTVTFKTSRLWAKLVVEPSMYLKEEYRDEGFSFYAKKGHALTEGEHSLEEFKNSHESFYEHYFDSSVVAGQRIDYVGLISTHGVSFDPQDDIVAGDMDLLPEFSSQDLKFEAIYTLADYPTGALFYGEDDVRTYLELDPGDEITPAQWARFTKVYYAVQSYAHQSGVTEIYIPTNHKEDGDARDYPVVMIADGAFQNLTEITKVRLPLSLLTIGKSAFEGCTSLSEIELPEGLTELGDSCFKGCSALDNVNIPKTLLIFGYKVFENTAFGMKLVLQNTGKDYIYLNNGQVLYSCLRTFSELPPDFVYDLSKPAELAPHVITFQDRNLYSIAGGAFAEKTGLVGVAIGKGVELIGNGAFKGCTDLMTFVPSTDTLYILDEAFMDCTKLTEFLTRDSLIEIGARTFMNCSSLVGFKYTPPADGEEESADAKKYDYFYIGLNLMTIGESAFENCTALTHVEMARYSYLNGHTLVYSATILNYIPERAFAGCTGLTEFRVMDDVVAIASEAFLNCTNLQTVYLGDTTDAYISRVEKDAFKGCTSLHRVTISRPATTDTATLVEFEDGCFDAANKYFYIQVSTMSGTLTRYKNGCRTYADHFTTTNTGNPTITVNRREVSVTGSATFTLDSMFLKSCVAAVDTTTDPFELTASESLVWKILSVEFDGKEIAADAQGKYDLSKAGLYTVRFSVSDAYGVSSSDQIYLVVSEQQ